MTLDNDELLELAARPVNWPPQSWWDDDTDPFMPADEPSETWHGWFENGEAHLYSSASRPNYLPNQEDDDDG